MNILDKRIFYLSIEIICIGFSILITNQYWKTLNLEESASIAYLYANVNSLNLNYNETNYQGEKTVNINIVNSGEENKKYNLYIKVNKKNIDVNNNYIRLKENNYKLNNFESYTDTKYTYFLIDTSKIEKNSINTFKLKTNLTTIDFKLEEPRI